MKRAFWTTYLLSVLAIMAIIVPFFALQYTLVVGEFHPRFVVMPIVASLVLGYFLARAARLRLALQENHVLLARANQEIAHLGTALQAENRRMAAELEVTRQLQQMLLPREAELAQVRDLDIACRLHPAYDVGGDYYDVLEHDGRVKIGIGDMAGHGLESGVLLLMVQMAVRTLLNSHVAAPERLLEVLNRAVFANLQRMGTEKNLSLALIDYQAGLLRLAGHHQEVLVVRRDGAVERIDTRDLGVPLGAQAEIGGRLGQSEVRLEAGDGIVLYTDGLLDARNPQAQAYGLERLCQALAKHWRGSAAEIADAVMDDLWRHVDQQEIRDDMTLLVCKQQAAA